ncbi:MAG: tyrosine-protein kinase domain-containing protein [Acidimicrobiales bacterium]
MIEETHLPEPTLSSYLFILRRRKWWIVGVTVVALVIAGAYSVLQPKSYSATAQLLIQPENSNVTVGGSQQAITPTDVLTELQLITSAPVKAAVRKKIGSEPNVAATEVGATNVIAVTATASSPSTAALIANAYANAFVVYERTTTINNLASAEGQLQHQISSLDAQIKTLEANPASASQVSVLLNQQAILKGQLAQLQVNGAVTTGGVQVVTPATPPGAPTSPNPKKDGLLALVAGVILGIGIAFLVENLDDKIYLKEEVERTARGWRVLAPVPMVSSWKNKNQTLVVTAVEPNSGAGEAYRSLRTSLQFAALGSDARVILVTSPSKAEGKSSTVANLGMVFATAGERVVIVSCDLRRPRLGEFFGVDESVGLTNVLLGQRTLEEALQPVPHIEGLSILASGERPSDPTGVLNSNQLADVFDQLRHSFDLVLVDSPPVLPVTDAVILSQVVDATVVVVAAGQTRAKELRRAAEALSLVHANVIGIVLNEVTKTTGYGYGYGGYNKRYGYGEYAPTPASTNGNGKVAGVTAPDGTRVG